MNERDRSCNQVGGSRILSGLDCKLSNRRSVEIPELDRSCAALHCRRGVRLREGGTRRKDNNLCSSFNTAEKTKEPSGF